MTRLIYWYGTENLEEGYSFYQANKIVSHDKGLEKGNDKVPPGIQKKLDGNKKLTKTDKQIVKGLEQIAEDAQLEPSERVAWLPEWAEDWEDDDNFDDKLEEDEEEDELEDDDSRSKKKGGNKSKKGKDDSSADKKRKKKKGKKRKKAGDDTDDDDLGDAEADATGQKSGASDDDNSSAPLAPKSKKKAKSSTSRVVYKDDNEEPDEIKVASDDENDEDFSDEVSSSSDEEEEYVEDPGSGSGPKKRKRKADDGDAAGRKKKGSGEPKAKREKKDAAASKGPKINSKAAEQRCFDECEDLFLPLMRELKVAIGADDLKTCELCVMKFQRYVEKVTPSFIRVHQFGLVVKESRKAFKSKGRDDLVSLCHELTKDLKRIYTEKLPLMPEGFEPKIRRQKKKDTTSAKKKPKVEEEDSASDDEADDRKNSTNAKISNGDARQAVVVDISKKSVEDEPSKSMAPEKKTAFSLKGMFQRPQKAAPVPKEKSASIPVQRSGGSEAKQMPSWLKGPPPADTSAPSDDERSLAVEFLQDAFAEFPAGKIDADAASHALEAAINDWSAARGDKSEVYWEKTHDIVAALAGIAEPTPLVQELLDGKFETPRDFLRMTRKRLNGYVGGWTD